LKGGCGAGLKVSHASLPLLKDSEAPENITHSRCAAFDHCSCACLWWTALNDPKYLKAGGGLPRNEAELLFTWALPPVEGYSKKAVIAYLHCLMEW